MDKTGTCHKCTGENSQDFSVLIITPNEYFSLAAAFFLEIFKTSLKDIGDIRVLTRSYPRIFAEVDISFVRDVLLLEPNVIGFSNFFWNLGQNIKLAQLAKSLLTDTFIVFGGPQVGDTCNAAALLEKHQFIDAILCGEADQTFPELVRKFLSNERLSGLPGLAVRDRNGINIEQGQCYVRDINTLPLIFHSEGDYAARYLNTNDLIPLQTLRGCRQACSYCLYCSSAPRLFSLTRVEKELAFLCEYGARYVRICDSHFGGSKNRAMELFDMIRYHNKETAFSIYPDPLHLSQDYIQAAERANCRIISLGVETLDPAVSLEVNRGPNSEFTGTLDLLARYEAVPQLDMMFGLPKQSELSFRKDLIRLKLEGARNILFSPLMVFPGTRLDSSMDDLGISTLEVPQRYGYDRTLGLNEYTRMIATSVCYCLLYKFPRVDNYARFISSDISDYKKKLENYFCNATSSNRADLIALYDSLSASSEYLRGNAASISEKVKECFCDFLIEQTDKPGLLEEIVRMDIMEIAMKQKRDELARDILPKPGSVRVVSESESVMLKWILNRDTWLEKHSVPYKFAAMGRGRTPDRSSDEVYCIYFCPTCTINFVDKEEFEFLQFFTQAISLSDSKIAHSSEFSRNVRKWARTGVLEVAGSECS